MSCWWSGLWGPFHQLLWCCCSSVLLFAELYCLIATMCSGVLAQHVYCQCAANVLLKMYCATACTYSQVCGDALVPRT